MIPSVKIKRVYETAAPDDGYRILVDRLWPRGLSKARAKVDLWLKDIAPSTELRKWFGHDATRWQEFEKKYKKELKANPATDALLDTLRAHKTNTLLYGAKDELHNQAQVLLKYLELTLKIKS